MILTWVMPRNQKRWILCTILHTCLTKTTNVETISSVSFSSKFILFNYILLLWLFLLYGCDAENLLRLLPSHMVIQLLPRFLPVVNDFDWTHVIHLIYCDFIHSYNVHIYNIFYMYVHVHGYGKALPFICQIHSILIPHTHSSIHPSVAII